MATTPRGYPYPAATDANDVPADLQALAQKNDDRPGISPLTTAARDALAGADLWDGRVIYNLTTSRLERYNAAVPAWQSAGISDHGDLTGLADDDHPQYLLKTDNLLALTDKAAARENLGANTAYEVTRALLSASSLDIALGAPTLGTVGSGSATLHPAWLLDPGATEVVAGMVVCPPGWATANVVALMVNPTTGTGNYVLQLNANSLAPGEAITGTMASAAVTTAAGTQYVRQDVTLGGVPVTPGDPIYVNVRRLGADAADTFAADMALIGIYLVKAS
jgi:hypothetical protein